MHRDVSPGELAWCVFVRPNKLVVVIAYVWSEWDTRLIEVFDPFDSEYMGNIRTFHPDYIVPLGDDVKLHRIDMIMNGGKVT